MEGGDCCVNCLPADEEVHRRVEVLVLYYSCNDQDVFQQRDDSQDQKDLRRVLYCVTERIGTVKICR